MRVWKSLGVLLVAVGAVPGMASTPWTLEDADSLSKIVPACSGGVYSNGETRNAQTIAASLPRAGEEASTLDEKRASDVYRYAGALLKPAIANPERAWDPSTFVKCPPDPVLGAKLMMFLAGDQPGRNVGLTNSFYWLGMAYRRGIGLPLDPIRARQNFLHARMLGHTNLTAEDWGDSPGDELLEVVRKPENRRWLEAAAATRKPGAMLLLAELIVDEEPARAKWLLAEQSNNIFAARELAEYEMSGKFGAARPDEAVRAMARFQRLNKPDYDLMIRAARQYNGSDNDVPVSPRPATLDELGGQKILVAGQKEELDSIRGIVRARALVDPTGAIIYTEVADPQIRRFRMAYATLNVFAPSRLKRVAPLLRGGRPVFHWLNLPPIRWTSPPGTSAIHLRAEDLP